MSTFDSADSKACICKIQEKKKEKFAKGAYLSSYTVIPLLWSVSSVK